MTHKLYDIGQIQQLVQDGFHNWELYGAVTETQKGDLVTLNCILTHHPDRPLSWFEKLCRELTINCITGAVTKKPYDIPLNSGEEPDPLEELYGKAE